MAVPTCKAVDGFPMYDIYSDGRIYSHKSNKFLIISVGNNGYSSVELSDGHMRKRLSVHRLVATAFIPNPAGLPCVNHKDENKTNNNVSNLEWCTYKYNSNYGHCKEKIRANRRVSKEKLRKFQLAGTTAVMRPVENIDTCERFRCVTDAARTFGIDAGHISEVCKKKRRTAGGYRWQYSERG